MLVVTRKEKESIIIGNIEITVTELKGSQVRIGINAPKEVTVMRKELLELTRTKRPVRR